MTIDDEVVSKSGLIRHVSSKNNIGGVTPVWKQKRASTLIASTKSINLNVENTPISNESRGSGVQIGLIERKHSLKKKNKKSIVLNRSEGELIEEYKIRGYMLYYKYVAIGSEFEINIDYGTRNKLVSQINDINQWLCDENVDLEELSVLFDNCIHQMYQFCKFSMGRFKQSDGFEALVRCFNIVPQQEEAPVLVTTPVSP